MSIKLLTTSEQNAELLRTMKAFNDTCNYIAAIAFREQISNRTRLHPFTYKATRVALGASSEMVTRATDKVCEVFKRDKAVQPYFRPLGAMVFSPRIMRWKDGMLRLRTISGHLVIEAPLAPFQVARMPFVKGQADLIFRDGTFYIVHVYEVEEPAPYEADGFLGVDLGIVNIASDNDGTVYTGTLVEDKRRVFAHRRRNLQRKGSRSAKRKLRAIAGKQARFQRDTNHVISKSLVRHAKGTERGIALEDLKGIRDRITVRRRQRSRHHNWAFAQLRTFIEYKAKIAGVPVVLVDPRNTSRTCPECGCIDKANRRTQSQFLCISCSFAGAADTVAAGNIASRARAAAVQPMVAASG